MIRHVYTPAAATVTPGTKQVTIMQHPQHCSVRSQQQYLLPEFNQKASGQFVLIHRANVCAADNQAPRASSAPPSQNQVNY